MFLKFYSSSHQKHEQNHLKIQVEDNSVFNETSTLEWYYDIFCFLHASLFQEMAMWVKKYWPKQKMLDGRIPNCQVLDFWAWKCFSKLYYCTDNIIFKHLICQRWSLWVTKYFEVFRKGMCRLNRELGIMSTAIGTNFTTMN